MDEKTLRRFGICKGEPGKRRNLALLLPKDCTEDALRELIRQAGLEAGIDAAPERVVGWLEDGRWRDRWKAHLEHAAKVAATSLPAHRLRGLVVGRVLGDRVPVARVAAEFGLPTSEVMAIVATAAEDRGMGKEQLEKLLGIAT